MLNLLGGVALLLWGTTMVQGGISRAYSAALRRWIGAGMGNPVTSLLAGVGVTLLLQSSTATALLMTTLAGRGIVATAPGLAVLLGADIGTTLVAQVFSLDLSWLAPLLVLAGVALYRNSQAAERQELARVGIGLGLMLLALHQIVAASQPLRESGVLPGLLTALGGDRLILVLIGALLAWLAHSSIATVLLVMSLGSAEVISLHAAFALVLGINVGGVLPPLVSTFGKPAVARRLPLGNLFFKLAGASVALPLLATLVPLFGAFGAPLARQIVNFHTLFNASLALVFLFLTPWVARLTERILPERGNGEDPAQPQHLDPGALKTPSVAIALAERETLRMGDFVESMLRRTMEALRSGNLALAQAIGRDDDVADRLNEAIKLYLTRVSREPMSEKDSRRIIDIITFATNLEHIGDIIDKNLMELVAKMGRNRLQFSEAGLNDIVGLHERLLESFALALNVFMKGEVEMARRLLAEKTRFRDLERQAVENHLLRLKSGKLESIDTTSIHIDVLRDWKRINSHITAVAYPILDRAGELRESRLMPAS
ncbi:MAG: Na/Pi cotransporter family protein [Candidatus Lambdaproteobacteria bacterium]|nr:Na/Pi cotransporter family protein [Candidatus Lambdaproteobacteria bacterium]